MNLKMFRFLLTICKRLTRGYRPRPAKTRFTDAYLNAIVAHVNILRVVMEKTTLYERESGRWWGRCPLHADEHPSLFVSPAREVWYCFRCHKGGGMFQFVMETEKVPFAKAVEILAKRAGMQLPEDTSA